MTLTWPTVDPNGPTPVRYTVLPQRRRRCPPARHHRDPVRQRRHPLRRHSLRVRRQRDQQGRRGQDDARADGRAGAPSADPRPGARGPSRPTGQNAAGHGDLRRAAVARRARRTCGSCVNGTVGQGARRPRPAHRDLRGADQRRALPGRLEVCNEKPTPARPRTAQNVQTYGPLHDAHVISARSSARTSTAPRSSGWTVTVDTNGDPATVRVRSGERDETFAAQRASARSAGSTSSAARSTIGYSTTEHVRDPPGHDQRPQPRHRHAHRDRADHRRTRRRARHRSSGQPGQPVQRQSRQRRTGLLPRRRRHGLHPRVLRADQVRDVGLLLQDTATCDIYDSVDGQYASQTVRTNRSDEPSRLLRLPGPLDLAVCNGERSDASGGPSASSSAPAHSSHQQPQRQEDRVTLTTNRRPGSARPSTS